MCPPGAVRAIERSNGGRRALVRHCHIFGAAVREVLEEQVLAAGGGPKLTAGQFHLLRLICRKGLHQIGHAAEFLGVSAPAATKTIDKLVQLGLVVRRASRRDRRVQLLTASARGRRLVRRCEKLRAARVERAVSAFQPAEIDQFTRLLERFAAALYAAGRVGGDFCLRCAAEIGNSCPVAELRGGCPYQETYRLHRASAARNAAASPRGKERR